MRLNFGKRLVLILHWLMSLVAAAMALMFCVWPETICGLFDRLNALVGTQKTDIIAIAALAVYVLLSIGSAVILFSNSAKREQKGFIIVDSSDAGKTRIAVSAVEQMIRQAVRSVEGITEMKSGIINHEDAISINTNVAVAGGAHVPTVTMNIQRAIRSYIELNCGVAVRQVSVNVHAVEMPTESAKRGRKFVPEAAKPAQTAHEPAAVPTPREAPEPAVEVYEEPATETVKAERKTVETPIELSPEAPDYPAADDEPIRLTFDPPKEMVNESHPLDD